MNATKTTTIESTRSQLVAFARRRGIGYHDAEDAAQDAAIALLTANIADSADDCRRFLFTAAGRRAVDTCRRNRVRRHLSIDCEIDSDAWHPVDCDTIPAIDADIEDETAAEVLAAVTAEIESRDEREGRMIRAMLVDGREPSAVATDEGIAAGTARMLKCRVVASVRRHVCLS